MLTSDAVRLISILAIVAMCGACAPEANAPAVPSSAPSVAAAPAAASSFGEVAFQTFASKGFRVVFLNDKKARKTWANMGGPAVVGDFTQSGKEIVVQWDPSATHHGSTSERFRQIDPCALARYERVDREGVTHDDQPQIYQRTEPRCDSVRLVQ